MPVTKPILTRVVRIDASSVAPRRQLPRYAAPLLLALSVCARLAWTYLVPHGTNFVDLHVYIDGAAALNHPGTLYEYTYTEQTPDFSLPFTYPPFAAIVFYPLHLVPFGVVALGWQLGVIAALYGVVRVSQRLLGITGARRVAMLWTAVGIWTEPVRSALNYGQINMLLALAVLVAVCSARWWLSGLLLGLTTGIKLTPAVAGLYFLGVRRWATVAFAAVVFAATIAVSYLVVGDTVGYYFTELLGDANRIGPVATIFNQSWRGGLSRIVGYDVGHGPLLLGAIAATAVLAWLAWRALRTAGGAPDRLGLLLVVELFGLLASPISWTHHWVWLVPLMIWLIHGPLRDRPGARLLGWGWLALTLIGVPWLLGFAQQSIWDISRPWYMAWPALVYLVATLITLAWIAVAGRRATAPISSR
ncbi:mannosyltransferase [Mycolicibacillus trivialis]